MKTERVYDVESGECYYREVEEEEIIEETFEPKPTPQERIKDLEEIIQTLLGVIE